MPSTEQKRAAANGRSADTATTVVSSRSATRELNSRTEAAHTPVSRDGKMFRITRRPRSSRRVTGDRSAPVRVKSGAGEPTGGSSPTVWTGVLFMWVVAMGTA